VEEIIKGLPHLNHAQVYDAISYYYDHKEEIDEEIRINNDDKCKCLLNSTSATGDDISPPGISYFAENLVVSRYDLVNWVRG
jgi:hypothetical protein